SSPDKLTQIGLRWLAGEEINWAELPRDGAPRKVSLPTYAFQRKRYWIEPLRQTEAPAQADTAPSVELHGAAASRDVLELLKAELTSISGIDLDTATRDTTLLNLGFD